MSPLPLPKALSSAGPVDDPGPQPGQRRATQQGNKLLSEY